MRHCSPLSGLTATIAALALAVGVVQATEPPPEPEGFSLDGDADRGREIYARSCATCHGENGDGDGIIELDPPPRDLVTMMRTEKRTDWELFVVVRDGGRALGLSPRMVGYGRLWEDQRIRDVVAYVRSLAEE